MVPEYTLLIIRKYIIIRCVFYLFIYVREKDTLRYILKNDYELVEILK
jgi:hypothetical protein